MRRSRWVLVAASVLSLVAVIAPTAAHAAPKPRPTTTTTAPATTTTTMPAPPPPATTALVLYDTTGPYGFLGQEYGMLIANLAGHFGTVKTEPVVSYSAGQIAANTATIYVGSTYDEPLPSSFLDDVSTATKPVVWMYDNIWELVSHVPGFADQYGFSPWIFDLSSVTQVQYKGATLSRSPLNDSGIMSYSSFDPTKATDLADAVRPDGTTFPWAVRSGNLTYLGEEPFSYTNENDRAMIFADLLFDALAPKTATRHRAMVRLEDVGPDADPADLRAIADYLSSQHVPFSFGVYPSFRDPWGVDTNGVPKSYDMAQTPDVRDAIQYMISKGGTMIMHGWTHQYSNVANPYDAKSADDFEFFKAHVDAVTDDVVYDGPLPGDSQTWAAGRIDNSFKAFAAARLPAPTIFEFPHYAGSYADYQAVKAKFSVRYERSLYFNGTLSGGPIDPNNYVGQFFPYVVHDVYGMKVLPENLGNVELEWFNNHPPRFPADIVASAKLNLVVRDGFASFFYHPYLGTSYLQQIVEPLKAMGYTFVSPNSL